MNTRSTILVFACLAVVADAAICQQPISLIDTKQNQGGWGFGNGAEFPGARGELKLAEERFREQSVLALRGDFTKGGNYVQADISLPDCGR